MLSSVTTKIEIDVMQANELEEACRLASTHTMPAMVVHQALTSEAMIIKGRFRGKFKIITPVDWPKGDTFGMNKLRGLARDHFLSDGFEIMLTGGKTEAEARNEARLISGFIHDQISPLSEVRFVLGCFTRTEAEVTKFCKIMKDVRSPTLLRTDHCLKSQATKASPKAQLALVEMIRSFTPCPIKISGNIDSMRTIAACIGPNTSTVHRFAVSLPQCKTIITDLQKQPDLRKLLDG